MKANGLSDRLEDLDLRAMEGWNLVELLAARDNLLSLLQEGQLRRNELNEAELHLLSLCK